MVRLLILDFVMLYLGNDKSLGYNESLIGSHMDFRFVQNSITILGCWTLTSSSECSTNTVTSIQKNSAVFIYRCYCSYCYESTTFVFY